MSSLTLWQQIGEKIVFTCISGNPPERVQFNVDKVGVHDGLMAIALDRKTGDGYVRVFREDATKLRRSWLEQVVMENPRSFTCTGGIVISSGLAIEDPTILPNHKLVATRVVKPISEQTDIRDKYPAALNDYHYAKLACVQGGQWRDVLAPDTLFNHLGVPLNQVKELEAIIPHGQLTLSGRIPCFFEAGGQYLPSQIFRGELDLDDTTISPQSTRPWLRPAPCTWYDTHVSTGPIVELFDPNEYLMFFNGRTEEKGRGLWRVGILLFHLDDHNRPIIDQVSSEPLFGDESHEKGYEGQEICFSSCWLPSEKSERGVEGTLYCHHGDNYITSRDVVITRE